ncbi:hypothetical protein ACB098_04G051300 [Castanea mollissima]
MQETILKEVELVVTQPCQVIGWTQLPTGSRCVSPMASPTTVEKLLPNGVLYNGTYPGNVPHGHGKYMWSNGCMFEGERKREKVSGKGKLSWPSGATYEGDVKSRKMDGFGTFIGIDGQTYKGSWLANRKHGYGEKCYANGDIYRGYMWSNGNEYESEWKNEIISGNGVLVLSIGHKFDIVNVNATRKRSSVDVVENVNSFPRICIWELDVEAGDITCDIVDNVEVASIFYKDGNEEQYVNHGNWGWQTLPSLGLMTNDEEVKKPDQKVSKGHKNYDLMINLQMGIRYTVGKHASMVRELRPGDFDPIEKFWTRFPHEGSKFHIVLHLYFFLVGFTILRELSSLGKSGSVFYLTQDDQFMIKTIRKSEVKVLLRMLPSYHQHFCQYKNSLITKFYGFHCIKLVGGHKFNQTHFIVMGNLFCSEYQIHKWFNLKGSSYGRTTYKPKGKIDETTTLKDFDLNYVFHLERSWGPPIRLGANMPARAEERVPKVRLDQHSGSGSESSNSTTSQCGGEVFDVILYFGIIDILQDYDSSKKLEHAYKSLQLDPASISVVDLKLYSKRF